MDFSTINYFAVLASALSTFVLGGLWYSPLLFGKAWMLANGFTEANLQTFSKARMFGWSFLFSLVMALNLAMFLAGPTTNVTWGMAAGGLAGFGWVAMAVAIVGVFENRSWKYIAINGGYMTVAFVIMGAIIGAWR
jgi:hypothetical protein